MRVENIKNIDCVYKNYVYLSFFEQTKNRQTASQNMNLVFCFHRPKQQISEYFPSIGCRARYYRIIQTKVQRTPNGWFGANLQFSGVICAPQSFFALQHPAILTKLTKQLIHHEKSKFVVFHIFHIASL